MSVCVWQLDGVQEKSPSGDNKVSVILSAGTFLYSYLKHSTFCWNEQLPAILHKFFLLEICFSGCCCLCAPVDSRYSWFRSRSQFSHSVSSGQGTYPGWLLQCYDCTRMVQKICTVDTSVLGHQFKPSLSAGQQGEWHRKGNHAQVSILHKPVINGSINNDAVCGCYEITFF